MTDKAAESGGEAKKDKRPVIAVSFIAFLVVVGVIIFILVGPYVRGNSTVAQSAQYLKLPTISAVIKGSDGKQHSIDIDLLLEQNSESKTTFNRDELVAKMQESVASLDYDRLCQPDSVDYIKATVAEDLNEHYGGNEISNVYLGNIVIDFPGAIGLKTSIEGTMRELLF